MQQLNQNTATEVPVTDIHPDPEQPRHQCHQATINEIVASAKKHGFINPITLRPHPSLKGDWLIVHGETRWRAAKQAGLTFMPARLAIPDEIGDPITRIIRQATDNLSAPLSPLDWGHTYLTLSQNFNLSTKAIEKLMIEHGLHHHGASAIKNLMRIAQHSPEWVIKLVESDIITPSHAKVMLNIDNEILTSLRDWLATNQRPPIAELEAKTLELHQQRYPILGDSLNLLGCTGCPNKKSIMREIFCLDQTCFDAKTAEHRELKYELAQPGDITSDDDQGESNDDSGQAPEVSHQTITTHTITEQTAPAKQDENQDEMFEEIRELNPNTFCLEGCQICPSRISIDGEGSRNHCDSAACWDDKSDAARDLKEIVVLQIIQEIEQHFKSHPIDICKFLNWCHLGCPIVIKNKMVFRKSLFCNADPEQRIGYTLATTPSSGSTMFDIASALIKSLAWWSSCQRTTDIGREIVKTYHIQYQESWLKNPDIPINTNSRNLQWAWDQLIGAEQ